MPSLPWTTVRNAFRRRPPRFRYVAATTTRIAQLEAMGIFPTSVLLTALNLPTRTYFTMRDTGLAPEGAAGDRLKALYAIVHYANERLGEEMPMLLRVSSRSHQPGTLGALFRTHTWTLDQALETVDAISDRQSRRRETVGAFEARRRTRAYTQAILHG